MYQVEDQPMETIHLYVVREVEEKEPPPLIALVVSLLALSLLITLGIVTPYVQPEIRTAIRVPAVPSFTKTFSAAVTIVPTGVKSYPATFSQGVLTFTNGSIIGQNIPAGFTVASVATDSAVYVPGATVDGFGSATVPAHALAAGINLPTLAVNAVIGSSLFIRNLAPFTGGHPSYSVTFVTQQDRLKAIQQARAVVTQQIFGLHYPCKEKLLNDSRTVTLAWECQFVTYSIPSYMRATSAVWQGNYLLVDVVFVVHPKRIWVK